MAGKAPQKNFLQRALELVKPARKVGEGIALTPTWWMVPPGAWRPLPSYRDHLIDITAQRTAYTSPSIMEVMFTHDPDVSAALNAFLTVADTEPVISIRNIADGTYNSDAYRAYEQVRTNLGHQFDLRDGYERRTSFRVTAETLRYMLLLRGACALEVVTDPHLVPVEFRQVDPISVRWLENIPGYYKPIQFAYGLGLPIDLDIPTFFFAYHRTTPLNVYSYSPFVASINTIVSRQQAINDLFRIMQVTGMPRMEAEVMESVLSNAAPANIRADPDALRMWLNARIGEIQQSFINIAPDQALVHSDSVKLRILNEKAPGLTLNIEPVINALNAQNQAALKTMGTILGRGESGVNTASVEARLFALNADALNKPVAEVLGRSLTCTLQLLGYPVVVEVSFRPAEMRPATELEPQLMVRQARILQALSLGIITDDEAHLTLFNRLPPAGSPKLSGTNFQGQTDQMVDTTDISPNSDPLGRSMTRDGGNNNAVKDNAVGGPGGHGKGSKK